MATRPGIGRVRRSSTPSPLSTDQVTQILARHAEVPLSTSGVVDYCRSRHPEMPINTEDTTRLLLWLYRHGRVDRWRGSDTHALEREGVVEPRPRNNYWRLRRTVRAENL
jgi:hypothetical protein